MQITNFRIGFRLNFAFALTIALLAVVVALGATELRAAAGAIEQQATLHGAASPAALTASSAARRAAVALLVLGAGGAFLSVLTGWVIAGGIVRPVRHAVKVARTVAAGDLASHIEVRSQDEVGQLSAALKEMNESLSSIVMGVRNGTAEIHRASSDIASGNRDLSQRTETQAAALQQTAASMEQLLGTVRQNADSAQQANQLVMSASAVAQRGGAAVGEVVAKMDAINVASRKVVDIIGVIDSIAFQTNILALNAAVEAARAGEQGRGFAVVAGEVRTLAQRSAAAAQQVKALIGDSAGQVDAGARLATDAGRTMEQVVASVQRVANIMSEISAASAEQVAGIEQVNSAIAQMDQTTRQNAALVGQAAAAATAMREQARQLADAVGVFRLAGGRAGEPAAGRQALAAPRTIETTLHGGM
ncbi:methyl-accepting chemotaxis protein [Massilia horti]|uniref:HAMP domain-containing protein n=1 Tax=Massilia horti TaxID=2562153 RepID=A0A4Y9T9Z7_9BURK|nr:methyl-accepting chemotaxis protein [Massilia horti]TFW35361.1 HAMP domain-containing protein [Massilia horti]